jgi:hypothetical protein
MADKLAMQQVTPLASAIFRYVKSEDINTHIAKERDVINEFSQRGYKPVTVYLAMCELYQRGYINGIESR